MIHFTLLLKAKAKNAPRVAVFLLLLTLLVFNAISPTVNAIVTQNFGTTDVTEIDSIPWAESIVTHSSYDTLFDVNDPDLSIIIMTRNGGDTNNGGWNNLMYDAYYVHGPTNKLQLDKYNDGTNIRYRVTTTGAGYYFKATIVPPSAIDAYKGANSGLCPWGSCSSEPQKLQGYTSLSRWSYSGIQSVTLNNYTDPVTPLTNKDIIRAKNITYSSTYDGVRAFNTSIKSGVYQEQCEDGVAGVACKIRNAFQGVTDGIKDVASTIMAWFVGLFIPTQEDIQILFDGVMSTLQDKLGFVYESLAYVVEFLQSFVTNPAWCSVSSCTLNAGSIFGQNYSINFATFHDRFPAVWDWAILFIRGTIYLTLILAFVKRYKAFVNR